MLTMDLEFSRVDYTLLGLTYPRTAKLLPSQGQKIPQKVQTRNGETVIHAVADRDGVLQVFGVKKGEIHLVFKTLPGSPVSCLQLGGALGTVQDKVFVSSGNEVRGYTKKGKLFLSFDTNLTEPIKSMYVCGSNLLVCGDHAYNQYFDCKDVNSFLCGDRIVDVIALGAEKGNNKLLAVLACEDRILRVLDRHDLLHSVELESVPSVLFPFPGSDDQILYGTVDGRIGVVTVTRNEVSHAWILKKPSNSSCITCMDCYDLTANGTPDLVVGRQDGSIDVYSFPEDTDDSDATLRFTYACNESITSVQCGVLGSAGYDEIVVTTYTGWLFGLTTEVIDKQVGIDTNTGGVTISQDAKTKILRLRSEIEELEQRVNREREKYQASTVDKSDGLSVLQMAAVSDRMVLCKEDASYLLSLEVQAPIDNVLIQSDVQIDLLDVEKNSAVVSYSKCDSSSGNHLLVTYRCQVNVTRLEVKLRTVEGQYGTLRAYVTPLAQPKSCTLKTFAIKPLSLHARCHHPDQTRPFNVLTLKGSFSLAEVHTWICFCLPEVPEKPPMNEKNVLAFKSAFTDTMLLCSYWKGGAEFKSDNISTISILKDVLTREATKKKIKLDILCAVNEESVISVLHRLHPRLEEQQKMAHEMSLLEALHELRERESGWEQSLLPEYRELLAAEKEVQLRYSQHPQQLERLYGLVSDLYIDRHKFKGQNVKGKIPQLLEILRKYDLQSLINFFLQS
ncbi:Bardet-Biedl syndrome 7 protein homolog isoform X1 [Schistocerca serialis cubense]|uniref:Bardet-Biedl syndrome 7 protein homolog isoform X1 n=1 Tax=Schistocerca serialis cubense TaxID=2023355 RepID=UPI00214E9405|nr:Bardet-Biedl syndrome 7 protein homolog isoform X1 [Schistocerca serialis cubense]